MAQENRLMERDVSHPQTRRKQEARKAREAERPNATEVLLRYY